MLDAILRPKSIAAIGASRRPGTIGHETVASLIRCGFTGTLYPVNPDAGSICSVPAFPSARELPGPVSGDTRRVRAIRNGFFRLMFTQEGA